MNNADFPAQRLPLTSLVIGDNPRTYFDQQEMDELIASVRSKGVIQPILVRPVGNDKYEIIAGERRYRASVAVYGDSGVIPAMIADVTKEESEDLALIENTIRADMSPTEEAEAAYKLLVRYNNDRDEVALRLGWPVSKVERRVALMRCAPEVRIALNERRILLGHAELLAALPTEKQVLALEKITEHKLTVEYVKSFIAKTAHTLEGAIFDKSECLNCNYNSSCQSALFAEALNDGQCTNAACYEGKTSARLESMREELTQDYPVVKIVALGDAVTAIPIVASGKMGVGEEQAKACRGCQNFGCTVSALPDSLGSVERGVCFDAACNTKKVAMHLRSLAPAPVEKAAKTNAASKGTPSKGKTPATTSAAKAVPKNKSATVQVPNKVKEYRVKLWRDVAKRELLSRPSDALTLLVALGVVGSARHISSSKMSDAFKKLIQTDASTLTHNLGGVLEAIASHDTAKAKMLDALSASAMGDIEESQLVTILSFLKANMAAHWKPCAEYFNLLTKSEIETVAEELGLKAAMGDKFAKLAGGKKDAFVKALLEVDGFDYSNAVPAVLVYGHKDASAAFVTGATGSDGDQDTDDAEPTGSPAVGGDAPSAESVTHDAGDPSADDGGDDD